MKISYDPATGERLSGQAKIELVKCTQCGITNADGDPVLDIPYPKIEQRDDFGGEMACDECQQSLENAVGDDKPYRDPTE